MMAIHNTLLRVIVSKLQGFLSIFDQQIMTLTLKTSVDVGWNQMDWSHEPTLHPHKVFFFFLYLNSLKKFWVILFTDNKTEYQAQMQTLTTSLAEVMWCGFRLLHSTRCNTFTKVLMTQWKRIVLQANETLYTVKGKYMVHALASGVAHTALHKYHTSSCTFFPCAF